MKQYSMLVIALFAIAATVLAGSPEKESQPISKFEKRCGWFSNPTPGNASLFDRDAEWIIGVQGGPQAEGDWPVFGPKQWIKTNVNYGYGCACLEVAADKQSHEVRRIKTSHVQPLKVCRDDRSLKGMFK